MKPNELIGLFTAAAVAGASEVLATERLLPETISKSEAYRRYGRTCVDRWIAEGLIIPDGKTLSRAALEAVSASSNRLTYLPVAER
ncbi:hypothetical protein G7092_01860 [Mucilaginibacter sp. HC2]|jgi:hypothetical protein|uniref:hypothetical protein n=1 Tax=Mucilaginibacter inviolabilis TaxID=2714892 RepID=UPI00140AE9F2|nr:hypothetical protein [Mucilaginibacter inviolabilis]NHA02519.1 hypothetical protein [Mucilaginibacter inviolabilis]